MKHFWIAIAVLLVLTPLSSVKAASFEVAGWIPWWQDTMGVESADDHIREFDILYPFAFEVNDDGSLADKADLDESKWQKLFKTADRRDVDIIPSVAWFDGEAIHAVLSNTNKREAHIAEIVEMVENGDYAGVNIDYESKLAETINYYSTFLEELKDELDDKYLTCTIEARTPPASRWREVPAVIEYANDYEAMAEHCDWVEIMAYDQQRADLKLNDERKGEPYIPVADTDWVEKVIELALEDIPAEKIMLGVPTYGRQWTLSVAPNWFKEYKSVGAINQPDAEELADDYDVNIGRNAAGEASYTFFPDDSPFKILDVLPVPDGTRKGFEAAAKALLFANLTDLTVPVNIVWYSDAKAIEEKVDLIEKYDLRGIAVFKIDGEEDSQIYKLF